MSPGPLDQSKGVLGRRERRSTSIQGRGAKPAKEEEAWEAWEVGGEEARYVPAWCQRIIAELSLSGIVLIIVFSAE
jgi:hypothetical protein